MSPDARIHPEAPLAVLEPPNHSEAKAGPFRPRRGARADVATGQPEMRSGPLPITQLAIRHRLFLRQATRKKSPTAALRIRDERTTRGFASARRLARILRWRSRGRTLA